jgi:soluble lytic murein transglycosylase-like protein
MAAGYILLGLALFAFGKGGPRAVAGVVAILWFTGVINPVADVQALLLDDARQSGQVVARQSAIPVSLQRELNYKDMADQSARQYGIDTRLFRALIQQESGWNPYITSRVGAVGLTQLMPATAAESCGLKKFELVDPKKNLDCGAKYLSAQLSRFGTVELALAAYNAGPERVAKLGRIPRIRETQDYVKRITEAVNNKETAGEKI